MVIVFASIVSEVVLSSGYFRGELFGFAIVPSAVRKIILFIEGVSFVVSQLIVPHNKFMNPLIIF